MEWCGPQRSGKQKWGKREEGSTGLSLGSVINPIPPGAAEGELAGLPVPV